MIAIGDKLISQNKDKINICVNQQTQYLTPNKTKDKQNSKMQPSNNPQLANQETKIRQKKSQISNKQNHHHSHEHAPINQQYEQYQQQYQQYEEHGQQSRAEPIWRQKQKRVKYRKQIFGDHYNYNYRKPNQHKMYRIQENRNTQIQRANRILLQKIQSIFKRSMGRKKGKQATVIQTESEVGSQVALTNKTSNLTQKAPHAHRSANQIKNSIKNIQPHSANNKNMKSMAQRIGKLGNINNNIQLARQQVEREERNSSVKKTEGSLNRNLIKLQDIQQDISIKRKRFQTEMNQPKTTTNANTSLQQTQADIINELKTRKKKNSQKNNDQQTNIGRIEKNNNRKTITSNSQHPPHSPGRKQGMNKPVQVGTKVKSQKIVLFKTKQHQIQQKVYKIQGYVQNNTYIVSAVSQRKVDQQQQQFHQIITMPYNHYQELYRQKLQQNHENILKMLVVEPKNGLLQVQGFQSKFMDIYQNGEIVISEGHADRDGSISGLSRIAPNNPNNPNGNLIVYYNNADDSLDRITFINSEHNSNTYGYGVYHRKANNKNTRNYDKLRDTPMSIKNSSVHNNETLNLHQLNNINNNNGGESRPETVPLMDKLKDKQLNKININSGRNNPSNKNESGNGKVNEGSKRVKEGEKEKREIYTMTDNILVNNNQAQEQYEKQQMNNNSNNNNKDISKSASPDNKEGMVNNSSGLALSRVSRKEPKLTSNLISIQIQPVNKSNMNSGRNSKKSNYNDSSFLSDLSQSNANKKGIVSLKKQQQQLLINPKSPSNTVTLSNKNKNNSNLIPSKNKSLSKPNRRQQYEDIQQIIQDNS